MDRNSLTLLAVLALSVSNLFVGITIRTNCSSWPVQGFLRPWRWFTLPASCSRRARRRMRRRSSRTLGQAAP